MKLFAFIVIAQWLGFISLEKLGVPSELKDAFFLACLIGNAAFTFKLFKTIQKLEERTRSGGINVDISGAKAQGGSGYGGSVSKTDIS